jgi:hypothetical protein
MECVLSGPGGCPGDFSTIILAVLGKAEIEIQILEVTAFVHWGLCSVALGSVLTSERTLSKYFFSLDKKWELAAR